MDRSPGARWWCAPKTTPHHLELRFSRYDSLSAQLMSRNANG